MSLKVIKNILNCFGRLRKSNNESPRSKPQSKTENHINLNSYDVMIIGHLFNSNLSKVSKQVHSNVILPR